MYNLAGRLRGRVQFTTDRLKAYLETVEGAIGVHVDYAQSVKKYGAAPEGERRYSPAVCTDSERKVVSGNPDKDKISTSYVERQNLTMWMHLHRFTRLTNGFSKKVENHAHAISLHFMYSNFAKVHKTLRATPAMAAVVSSHIWDMEEIAALDE